MECVSSKQVGRELKNKECLFMSICAVSMVRLCSVCCFVSQVVRILMYNVLKCSFIDKMKGFAEES